MKKYICVLLALAVLLSLAGCGSAPAAATQDLQAVYDSFSDLLPEMMVLDDDSRVDFLGITPEECTQVITAIGAEGMSPEEVWLIQAKDQQTLEKLEAMAQSRIYDKLEEAENYVPENVPVIQSAVVKTNGLYLVVLVSQNADGLLEKAAAVLN